MISSQLRAAFQGSKVIETSIGLEVFDLVVKLSKDSNDELADFDNFPIIHPVSGIVIPCRKWQKSYPRVAFAHSSGEQCAHGYRAGDIDAQGITPTRFLPI